MAERKAGPVRFAGYAAIFNRLDGGGDVIRPGAFTRSLQEARHRPLLWQHKTGQVIGRIESLHEDGRGLRVIASFGGSGEARSIAGLVRQRRLDGLSFGYRVRRATRHDEYRELLDLDLIEVSVVSRPMQGKARIHKVSPSG